MAKIQEWYLCPQYAGSIAEGTKIGQLDEVDFQMVITALFGVIKVLPGIRPIKVQISDPKLMSAWRPFVTCHDEFILPEKLYSHLHLLFCQALADPTVYEGTYLAYRRIKPHTREVFLEWLPTGLNIKLDPAFIVHVPNWIPQKCSNPPFMCHGLTIKPKCALLLKPAGWRPTPFAMEQKIMRNLPLVPKLAYNTLKILKDLIVYDAKDSHKVKTYDI